LLAASFFFIALRISSVALFIPSFVDAAKIVAKSGAFSLTNL
jgi:hypothetical protein